ncbi:hypothetical protein Sps_04734 [Shewanella psychrophila]|uniref:HTH cro/C1-type domain-containing protein n=1 Tax=Shewanella psychrophila TaxID=225848 RepID=A0A1S6HW56_9GAMM|nr:hypothetical protein Sps_04734 [Shewanella psychrophila]
MAIHSRGKTPSDIERETGISKSYISRVINNKITSPKKLIKTISNHLQISEEWIENGTGNIDIDSNSQIPIFDVDKTEYEGYMYINNMSGFNGEIKSWKGFDYQPFNKDSIVITTSTLTNSNGDYLIRSSQDCTISIVIRVNEEYKSKWFLKENVTEIGDIEKYVIIGEVISYIFSDRINLLEVSI